MGFTACYGFLIVLPWTAKAGMAPVQHWWYGPFARTERSTHALEIALWWGGQAVKEQAKPPQTCSFPAPLSAPVGWATPLVFFSCSVVSA